jgi:hypothetical protein
MTLRALAANVSVDEAATAYYRAHPYEVFLGPETTLMIHRQPAFAVLNDAIRWAMGRSDGREWRVRSSLTGQLIHSTTDAALGPSWV